MTKIELDIFLHSIANNILDETDYDIRLIGRERQRVELIKIFCSYVRNNIKLYNDVSITYSQIGKFLNRYHATVLHAIRTYNDLYFSCKYFAAKADFFNERFEAIRGKEYVRPYKEKLIKMAKKASEATCKNWLETLEQTEIFKQAYNSLIEQERLNE